MTRPALLSRAFAPLATAPCGHSSFVIRHSSFLPLAAALCGLLLAPAAGQAKKPAHSSPSPAPQAAATPEPEETPAFAPASAPTPTGMLPGSTPARPGPAATPAAEDAAGDDADPNAKLAHSLNYRQGKIVLQGGLAELSVPDQFRYLDSNDARKVIVDLWGNPPESGEDVMGMIVPAGMTPDERGCYGVVISYENSGYVKDDDAAKINYTELLAKMQKSTHENNAQRVKAGYPAMELVGWAAPPIYDAAAKKMYWAKELQIGDHQNHTLNYDVRILGRHGVLVLSAIAGMRQLDEIKAATPQILSMVNYNQGHRYADFNPKTDKVAAYGLAALVAGGILAKAGGFKLLLVGLLAAKKFLIVGVVAVIGFFKRVFGGGEKKG